MKRIDEAVQGAAEFLKAQNEWDTIDVGRRADLILLEANLLEETPMCAGASALWSEADGSA